MRILISMRTYQLKRQSFKVAHLKMQLFALNRKVNMKCCLVKKLLFNALKSRLPTAVTKTTIRICLLQNAHSSGSEYSNPTLPHILIPDFCFPHETTRNGSSLWANESFPPSAGACCVVLWRRDCSSNKTALFRIWPWFH